LAAEKFLSPFLFFIKNSKIKEIMKKEIFVINLRGEKAPFSFQKVYQSARNAGASKEVALKIVKEIEKEVFDGISTSQIFDRVFELLLRESPQSAIKFNLKRAMEKLGPTGFPFEKFVAKIFEFEGFEVKTNQIVPGFCVSYEIDFVAKALSAFKTPLSGATKKENLVYIGECKFRHEPGGRIDLQVALANYARFLDIEKEKFLDSKIKYKSILVTNTKFTTEAIKYSECVGVELLGWKYPKGRELEFLIEKNQLYPITILPSITHFIAKDLISQGIVLVRDIFEKKFEEIKVPNKEKILKEAKILLKNEL